MGLSASEERDREGVRVTLGKRTYPLFTGEEGLDKSPCHKETKLPVAFFSHFLYQKMGDTRKLWGQRWKNLKDCTLPLLGALVSKDLLGARQMAHHIKYLLLMCENQSGSLRTTESRWA